jgi:hypothetical protein
LDIIGYKKSILGEFRVWVLGTSEKSIQPFISTVLNRGQECYKASTHLKSTLSMILFDILLVVYTLYDVVLYYVMIYSTSNIPYTYIIYYIYYIYIIYIISIISILYMILYG